MNEPRYSVHRVIIEHSDKEQFVFLILKDKLPDIMINKYLRLQQKGNSSDNYSRPNTTKIYQLCLFLNYVDEQELSISELTLTDIENFLSTLYLNGASGINDGKTVKYATLRDYVEVISSFYEYIVLSGYPYSPSLLVPTDSMALLPERKSKTRVKKKGEHLTKIHLLSKLYKPTNPN